MTKLWTAKSATMSLLMLALAGCTFCPEPITQCDRAERIAQDKQDMFACQEPIKGEISLSEAMARSLKYNLDLRLKTADSILARSDYSVTKYDMLPDFVASAGYLSRSNEYAVKTDPNSDLVSFSQDRHRRVADLQLTWNILDFGVSYVLAKQKGDQFLISIERRRKMEQNIERDVRYAYFRAVSAQRVIRKIDPLMSQVKQALSKSRKLETEQTQSPLEALRYQKSLLSTLRQLTTLRKELANAKRELASLMNVAPGQDFRVSEDINSLEVLPRGFPLKMSRLEYLALQHRPEIREEDYRTRISANEVTKAKLRMFPGLELTSGLNTDSNSFLVYNNWANYGAQLTWNLMRIFSGPANIERAKRELLVSNVRRMALSMAILTQVDVAYLRYRETRKELDVSENEKEVAQRIYRKVEQGFSAKKMSEMELIRAKTDMILSMLRYDLTYAEWQNSAGQVLNSVGYDLLPILDTTQPVRVIRSQLHVALNTEPTWLLRAHMAAGSDQTPEAQTALRAVVAQDGTIEDLQRVATNATTGDQGRAVLADDSSPDDGLATMMSSLWELPVSVDNGQPSQAVAKVTDPIRLPESPLVAQASRSRVATSVAPMAVTHTDAMMASMIEPRTSIQAPLATSGEVQHVVHPIRNQRSGNAIAARSGSNGRQRQFAPTTRGTQDSPRVIAQRIQPKRDTLVQLPIPTVSHSSQPVAQITLPQPSLPESAEIAQLPTPDIEHREMAQAIVKQTRSAMSKAHPSVDLALPHPQGENNKPIAAHINHKLDWITPQDTLPAASTSANQRKSLPSLAEATQDRVPEIVKDVLPKASGRAISQRQARVATATSTARKPRVMGEFRRRVMAAPNHRRSPQQAIAHQRQTPQRATIKPAIQPAQKVAHAPLPEPQFQTKRSEQPRMTSQSTGVKPAVAAKSAPAAKADYAAQEAAAIEHHARLQHRSIPAPTQKKPEPRMHFELIDSDPEDDTETV